MKFNDLSDEQKFEMFQAYRNGELKSKEDVDKWFESKEPSFIDKVLDARDKAEKAILDKFLPEKKMEDLTPEQRAALDKASKEGGQRPWQKLDEYLAERVGEKPVNLLEHPRFIAHPELAKNLNSVVSLLNVMSPTNDLLRLAGMGQGAHLSDISPTAARIVGDLSVRDAASLVGDLGVPAALSSVGKAAKAAAAAKPALIPEPKIPTAPPEVQEVATLLKNKEALKLQERATKALVDTLEDLKSKGLSNAETAAKVVNSYNLPISKEAAETLIQAFPDHPEVQKLKRAMERTAIGEARTKGNFILPQDEFVIDKGERTPITTVPDYSPKIGEPHPGATLDYRNDPRFKLQFQEGMKQMEFPYSPLVGEAAYTTTEPLGFANPIKGREGAEKLYTELHDIGKPDKRWHTPETERAVGADQLNLPIEDNPNFYKLLQLANDHAKYAPKDIEAMAMEARQARFGKVADELRDTLKGIKEPLPPLSEEDIANFARVGGEGTTGERVQNVRQDTTNRIRLQEDLAPIARGDKALALLNRMKGVNDTRAMAQELAEKYNLPHLLRESDLLSAAEDFNTSQENYVKKLDKISRKNAEMLAKFGERKFGILPSQQDLYNLSTRSLFAPLGTSLMHLGAEKAGKAVGMGLLKMGKYLPDSTLESSPANLLGGAWRRASLVGNVLAPQEEKDEIK